MILDLLKSVAGGLLLQACAAFAFGTHEANAVAPPQEASLAAAPLACLLPPAREMAAQADTSSTPSVTGTRP